MHKTPLVDSWLEFMQGNYGIGSTRRFVFSDALNAGDLFEFKNAARHQEGLSRVTLKVMQGYIDVTKQVPAETRDDDKHEGLPVAEYIAQTDWSVSRVNANKLAEERVLRILDDLSAQDDVDKRWLAIGRTQIEQGFMAVNRSIFKPERVKLD